MVHAQANLTESRDKKLRVLFVTSWYPTKQNPVAGVFVREHAKTAALYADVAVLHCAGPASLRRGLWHVGEELDPELTDGIRTYRVWWRRSPRGVSLLLGAWAGMRAVQQLLAWGFRPDVLHAHVYTAAPAAILAGVRLRVPVVLTEHYSGFLGYPPLSRKARWLARWAARRVKVVLPVSQALREAMQRIGIKGRYVVVPNTVNVRLFEPCLNGADGATASGGKKRLVTVALLTPEKGIPVLLRALRILRSRRSDFVLDIVGDGPQRVEYETLAQELGLGDFVRFHGLRPKREVVKFLHNATFFVLPSLCETFGVVLIEALATGKPIVASAVGSIPEIVSPEVGRLVPPGEPHTLAAVLDEMLNSYQQYEPQRLVKYAKEKYSYEVVGHQLYDIYTDVRSQRRA